MPNSKLAIWGGRGFLLAAVVVFLTGLWGYSEYNRFHSRVKILEQTGQIVSFDQLYHAVDDPANDGRTYLQEALADCQKIQNTMSGEQLVEKLAERSVDAESLARINEIFAGYPSVFENIDRAISSAEMSVGENNNVLPLMPLTLVLEQKAKLLLLSGDIYGAVQQGERLIQLSAKIASPGLLSSLMETRFRYGAWQVFCDCAREDGFAKAVSAERLQELFRLMQRRPLVDSYRDALLTERSLGIFVFTNTVAPDTQVDGEQGWLGLASRLPAGGAILYGNSFLDQMELAVQRSNLPFSQQFEVLQEARFLDSQIGANPEFYDRIRNQFGSRIAAQRATMILMALRQSRESESREAWSEEFLESVGVPSECVVDPFTEDGMKIMRDQKGWRVYSVGPDKTDNQFNEGSDDRGMRIEF